MPVQSRHMMTILYFFTILIMISGSFYPAFALDTSQTCDTIILPPHWPSSHIYITDTNESSPYIPLTDHTTIFHDDDVWNTSTQPRDVHVTLTIQDQDTGQQVFNQTQSLQMKACSGPESVKWRFVPTQIADYHANLSDNRGTVGMIFYSMLDATKSQTVSSPLEQLRFGIDSHNVVCKQDLQLVIKSEDGFPACVTKQTAQILVERGWGTFGESSLVNSDIHGKNGTLSGTVVLAGGPASLAGPKTNYEVDVYAVDGITLVGKTFSDANAHYTMQLPAGNYTVYVPDYPDKQTHFVSVFPDENTIFNIVYGTGYK